VVNGKHDVKLPGVSSAGQKFFVNPAQSPAKTSVLFVPRFSAVDRAQPATEPMRRGGENRRVGERGPEGPESYWDDRRNWVRKDGPDKASN